MEKFAKLFESEVYGQILVKVDRASDDEAPEVRFFVSPPDLGVCSIAFGYEDEDQGWDKAEKCFAETDQTKAEEIAKMMFDQVDRVRG